MEKVEEAKQKKPLRIRWLSARNFGPLKEADIELGDITILIGPQNSGKTILATLIYTLNNTLQNFFAHSLASQIARHIGEKHGEGKYNEAEIAKIISEDINVIHEKIKPVIIRELTDEIRANYQVAIETLVKKGAEKSTIQYGDFPTAKIEFAKNHTAEQKLSVAVSQDSLLKFLTKYYGLHEITIRKEGRMYIPSWFAGTTELFLSCFYVPAERIYLLHSLADIIDLVFEVYERISSRYEKTRKLIGLKKTVLDYVRELNRITRRPYSYDLLGVGDVVVSDAGEVTFLDRLHEITVPLHFAGSGIAQLAGIVLPLSTMYLDFVVIEEPEINLHADMQLRAAEYLAEVSKSKGIQMVLTTHSEHFLAKMAHLYAKGVINDLKAYYLNPETERAEKLELSKETGEVELPESIEKAIEGLAEESLTLMKQFYKREEEKGS